MSLHPICICLLDFLRTKKVAAILMFRCSLYYKSDKKSCHLKNLEKLEFDPALLQQNGCYLIRIHHLIKTKKQLIGCFSFPKTFS